MLQKIHFSVPEASTGYKGVHSTRIFLVEYRISGHNKMILFCYFRNQSQASVTFPNIAVKLVSVACPTSQKLQKIYLTLLK